MHRFAKYAFLALILTALIVGTASASRPDLSKSYPGASHSYVYNASGMVLSTSKTTGTVNEVIDLDYHPLGEVYHRSSTLSTPGGLNNQFKQTYLYDQDGRPTTLYYDGCTNGACTAMGIISTVYDALGRKSRMMFPGGSASWIYHGYSNRLSRRNLGWAANANASAASVFYTYEPDGDLSQMRYELDGLAAPVSFDFVNDGAGRLVSETVSDPSWAWKPSTSRTVAYDGANALDQLTGYTRNEGTTTPEVTDLCYDGSGNLSGTSSTGSNACSAPQRSYTHDANNRMTGASDTITAMSASYVYGAEDTRIYKQDGSSGRRFSMNGNMVLGEHPGSVGSALGSWTLYIPGLGIDDRVAMVTMSGSTALGVHFYLPNRLGSVIGMVGGLWGSAAHGTLTDQYLYSPYGVEEPLAASGNPFRYTGRYYDGETGLYYYRSRYYDPGTGRFPSPDSILYDGGLNLYGYVGGNPINNVDPLGTEIRLNGSKEFRDKVFVLVRKLNDTKDGLALLTRLSESSNVHTITSSINEDEGGGINITIPDNSKDGANGKGTGSIIAIDPDRKVGLAGTVRPPVVGLAHELGHADALDQGEQPEKKNDPASSKKPGRTPPSEKHALKIENKIRQQLTPPVPRRKAYNPGTPCKGIRCQ